MIYSTQILLETILSPLPFSGEGLFPALRRTPFNQQSPFDLEDLTAELLLA